jgi:predicted nucleic acid-binding protein
MGLVFVDTCLVIFAFEDHPLHGPRVRQAFEGQAGLSVSPLVKLECLVGPMRSGNLALQRYYEEGLAQFNVLDMPEQVYLLAAALRARFSLKTPDALHLATAQFHGCQALWTNDDRLASAACGLAVNMLHPPPPSR